MLNDAEMRHETEIVRMTIHFLQCNYVIIMLIGVCPSWTM